MQERLCVYMDTFTGEDVKAPTDTGQRLPREVHVHCKHSYKDRWSAEDYLLNL